MSESYRSELRPELESRFEADEEMLERVLDEVERARQMDELEYLHWDDPEGIAGGVEDFSRGHGLKAGWNTWIGVQEAETKHLTVDPGE